MRFKTVIKIVSDANNKGEAIDLVEEYLSGNISSGVKMKCVTKPIRNNEKIVGAVALSLVMVVGIFMACHVKGSQGVFQSMSGINAVQPPLKTSSDVRSDSEFKKEWREIQTKEALDKITR